MKSLRPVRCPFCGKRFNIAGTPTGTRLRCSGCTAVLAVPDPGAVPSSHTRLTRSVLLQGAGGMAAGLLAAAAIYLAFRPSTRDDKSPAPAAAARPPAAPPPVQDRPAAMDSGFVLDDPLTFFQSAIRREFGPGFVFYTKVQPYLLAFDSTDRYPGTTVVEEYGRALEALHGAFRREFADPFGFPPVDEILTVLVLGSRERFDNYFWRKDGKRMDPLIKGIYEYDRRRFILYHEDGVHHKALFHEGVHQLVHYYTGGTPGRRPPPVTFWFQEGLGTYFEGFRPGPGERIEIDPQLNCDRLPIIRQALAGQDRRSFIPLSLLVGMTRDDFWDWFEVLRARDPDDAARKAQLYYAESWAFVYFLRQKGGSYRKTFDEYFHAETSGFRDEAASGGPVHVRVVFERIAQKNLGKDLPELEEEFVEFVQTLRRP